MSSFNDLMDLARKEALKGEKKIQNSNLPQYNLTSKPKKATPTDRKLSEGVKKFLQKKEDEDRKRKVEDSLKKEKLLQLRSQDRKASRRVSAMLSMTKSANKSCMADAKDSFSSSLAEQGDFQPDEDDYGYVSQYSQDFHKKMLEKYKAFPTNPPAKSKPPAPIPTSKTLPRSHKHRKPEEYHEEESYSPKEVEYKQPEKISEPKKTKKAPPPSFQALIELANQKVQQEPVAVAMKLKPKATVQEKEKFEFGRPMTAKEKQQFLQEQAMKERVSAIFNGTADRNNNSGKPINSIASNKPPATFKIPSLKKKEPSTSGNSSESSKPTKSVPKPPLHGTGRGSLQNIPPPSSVRDAPKSNINHSSQKQMPPSQPRKPIPNQRPTQPTRSTLPAEKSKPKVDPRVERTPAAPASRDRMKPPDNYSRPESKSATMKSQPRPPPSREPEPKRQPPPPSPQTTRYPQYLPQRGKPPMGGRMPGPSNRPPQHRPKPPQKRPMVFDSDEEDSDMDDFICDDDDGLDVSSMIRQITGYDRNKYIGVDEGDIEESSVHQQWQEERRSARIGMQEDLEDMRKEEEEKKRKKMKMSKARR